MRSAFASGDEFSRTCDSATFQRMLDASVLLLSHRAESINALNVFPVPDGDTGTNLLLTMRAAARAAEDSREPDVGGLTAALAKGALMGARGNSGVILSQYLRGLARGLSGHPRVDGPVLARALESAASTARAAVTNPVEGTFLSVARDVAIAALAEARESNDLSSIMRRAFEEGQLAVARTKDEMPLLRQAGVVDAGGMGLLTILEAMYLTYIGQALPPPDQAHVAIPPLPLGMESKPFGYCTEYLIRGEAIDLEAVRAQLTAFGESLLVVGDPALVRVHVHTFEPGRAIDLSLRYGDVEQVKVENMQAQSARARLMYHRSADRLGLCALIAVSSGHGFDEIFSSLGASVVPGGRTMNPSTEEIVRLVGSLPSSEVIVLPNNPNVIPAARQAAAMTDKVVAVVPTRGLAEGVAASIAFQPSLSATDNVNRMTQALGDIRTGLVTKAIRDANVDGRRIRAGDVLGLIDDRIDVVQPGWLETSLEVLHILGAEHSEIVTIYAGEGVPSDEVEQLRDRVVREFPSAQVDVVDGNQPTYRFIFACE